MERKLEKETQEFIRKMFAYENSDGRLVTQTKVSADDISFIKKNKEYILKTIRNNKQEKIQREKKSAKEYASFKRRIVAAENNLDI